MATWLLLGQGMAAEPEWGRLFYSPQERTAPVQQQALPASAAAPAVRRYDGQMRRQQGQAIYWLDGQPGRQAPPAQVKPGELWQSSDGRVIGGPRVRVEPR
ncbi:hypothetical protein [Chitinilyticum piscinae]|uniref:Uncharacterized protein n=1 Tax=Chitinilyticum piscinae TaxID=2866724 RepID=A0A8J7K0B1_9NEIS|nr:hypothetical protein [Chitinilyticum piscinae]MBE9607751.1 hypothetical protein [Chitinilyticum piscinae]